MEERWITAKEIADFKEYLILEERSAATVAKYVRDAKAFVAYAGGEGITRETVAAYKHRLLAAGYAARSINSVPASLNCLFAFLGRHELRVKSITVTSKSPSPPAQF